MIFRIVFIVVIAGALSLVWPTNGKSADTADGRRAGEKSDNQRLRNSDSSSFEVITGKQGRSAIHIRNVTYLQHHMARSRYTECIVKKVEQIIDYGGENGSSTTFTLEFFDVDLLEPWPQSPFLSLNHHADSIKLEFNYYTVTYFGCCGGETSHALYAYGDKEPFITHTGDLVVVDIAGFGDTFLGYFDERRAGPVKDDKFVVGKLSLANVRKGPVQKLIIRVKEDKACSDLLWAWTPKMRLLSSNKKDQIYDDGKKLKLWSSPREKGFQTALSGFSVSLPYKSETLNIPVNKGRFDLANVKSKCFMLKPEDIEKKRVKEKDSSLDLKLSAEKRADLAYREGNKLIREKKFREAVEKFRSVLKLNPKLGRAYRGLGIAYAKLMERKKACSSYQSYLKTLPPSSKEVSSLKLILKKCK
jgi:hypothetical protein